MNIEFTSVKWKNLLSYGNAFTTYDFKKGLDLITASNGSGKCLRHNTEIEILIEDEEIQKKMKDFLNENKKLSII